MKIRDLIRQWETSDAVPKTAHSYQLQLPVYAAAKVAALVEMYPGRSETQILTDLLSCALDELSSAFAYVEGEVILSHDDQGDPIYADDGLTPRFLQLSNDHAQRLLKLQAGQDPD